MSRINFVLLSEVIKELGIAAVDPTMWPDLMQKICEATGTSGAGLLQSENRTADIPMTDSAREIFASYFRNELHINDVRAKRGAPKLLRGARVVSDRDLFDSERELNSDPLYSDLAQYGFKWWSAIGFWSGHAHWGMALQRKTGEGMFEDAELAALAMLSDRLTETATLSEAVGRQIISEINNAFALVDQPAIALDRSGRVIDVNARAAALFNDEFGIREQRIYTRDPVAKETIDCFLIKMRRLSDRVNLVQEPFVVKRRLDTPIIIRILPVIGPARGPFLGARAILTLSAIEAQRPIDNALLVRLFNLTVAESRLAALLGSGKSLDDASEQLGRTKATVRTQIKSIFAKTGTHRQGELVALLAGVR